MEEEAAKLKQMQNEVEKQMNLSGSSGLGKQLRIRKKRIFDLFAYYYLQPVH